MVDATLSVLALASLALFLSIIAWFVREPDLIILLTVGLVAATFDFWRSFRLRQSGG